MKAMNFFSASINLVSGPLTPGLGAAPLFDSGAALDRLNNPMALIPSAAQAMQAQLEPMLEMTSFLMELLTGLMLGSPSATGALGGLNALGQAGPVSDFSQPGARIQGGPSLYKHGMFHKGAKGAPNSYAFENSPAGIAFAARHGYSSIDIDMQITKDGVPVATHWSQPMKKDGFFDPEHKIRPGKKISQMTLAEVMRLRNKDGQSRILPLSTMLGELKKHNLGGDLEAKGDPRFANPQMMGQIADMVRKSGIKANLKTINYGPHSLKVIREAQRQGFWTRTAHGNGHGRQVFGYGG